MHSFNSEVKPVEKFADGLGASEKSRVKGHKLYRKIRKLRFLIKTLFLEKKKKRKWCNILPGRSFCEQSKQETHDKKQAHV